MRYRALFRFSYYERIIMLYLTGQLLFFLLVTAFLGFIVGWLLRGAMLPVSMFEDGEYVTYQVQEGGPEHARYQFVSQQKQTSSVFTEVEQPAES